MFSVYLDYSSTIYSKFTVINLPLDSLEMIQNRIRNNFEIESVKLFTKERVNRRILNDEWSRGKEEANSEAAATRRRGIQASFLF